MGTDLFDFVEDEVETKSEKETLEQELKLYREAYERGEPAVSDDVYDAKRDRLAEIDANSSEVVAIGSGEKSEWKKVAHGVPMGSLDKVNLPEQMNEWIASVAAGQDLFSTEKLDGLSVHIHYEKGVFQYGLTRGDGIEGDDITANVARMKGVPAKLTDLTFSGSIRGEIILRKSVLAKEFPGKANTRNTAAGTAKRFDGKGVEHLEVMCYQIVDSNAHFSTEKEQFELLTKLGLEVPPYSVGTPPNEVWASYQATRRDLLDYDIDGLVIRINDLAVQIAKGEKDGRPKGATAYKFAGINRETVCRQIVAQTGATGRITPVAVFDAVSLLGASVTNASLYNWTYIAQLGVDVGASILVTRANDVIPRVIAVTQGTGATHRPPTHCPSCEGLTSQDGEYVVCLNRSGCPAQIVGRIQAWITTLNILEWGDSLIQKLVAVSLVSTPADLYKLKAAQLADLERMGEKSAENVLKTLWGRNPVPLDQFIGGLSIPTIGTSMVRMMMDAGYDSLEKLRGATLGQIEAVHGLGPVKARHLYDGLKAVAPIIYDLLGAGVKLKEKVVGTLTGKSFCFTGSMKTKRPVLEQLVKDSGGDVKSSVGKGLTYLVMSDPSSTSSKATAARKHGTQCISEEAFLAMISP